MAKDFLGTEIKVGVKGVRVHSCGHSKDFKKVTVEKINLDRRHGDVIGVLTDGNTKIGWTYPKRVIVQESFNKPL